MQVCGPAGVWLCGYAARRWTGMGYVALWFPTVQHLAEGFLFSYPMPVRIWHWFYDFFHTLCYYAYGSLRIVEPQVLWIMEHDGMV